MTSQTQMQSSEPDFAGAHELARRLLENIETVVHGKNAETKDALLNWGLAAVTWLIAGRILDRIIRP